MKLSLKIAKALEQLINGEVLPASSAKSKLTERLIEENILYRVGKHRRTLHLRDEEALKVFLANQLQINNLQQYISAKEDEESTRAEFVRLTTESKDSKERAFKGFLVNSYFPIKAKLNGQEITINPPSGSFVFISDYERFEIPESITIVGMENARNFSQIHKQRYLFEEINPLFVSRYPQNQNQDFIRWIQQIPNPYLHFGDFDLAGISIYLNEYKKHLGDKASFFIPENIQNTIKDSGNRQRYNLQFLSFDKDKINELELVKLLNIIHKEKKGLDQEYFIK
ncbi:MAG TPA: hypothetical protein VK050_10730 [Flavobacteriaceae bacterium]|nr:hypothetical protein [Flavobacteriaceae bacterium]